MKVIYLIKIQPLSTYSNLLYEDMGSILKALLHSTMVAKESTVERKYRGKELCVTEF